MIRAYVADTGSDSSSGSAAYPFLTLAYAMTQITDGGEIIVMDDGIYAAFTIDKSVLVDASRGARVSVSSGNAINITAGPSKTVRLRGLELLGNGGGSIGVNATAGAALFMDDCRVSGFKTGAAIGINYAPPEGAAGQLHLLRVEAIGNGNDEFNGGVLVKPNLTGTALATLQSCRLIGNTSGLIADGNGSGGGIRIACFGESNYCGNSWHAIFITARESPSAITHVRADEVVMIGGDYLSYHAAVKSEGAHAFIMPSRCTLANNWYGLWNYIGGNSHSFGDNYIIDANLMGTDAPTATKARS